MTFKQAKEQAIDHFEGKEKELLAAMDQLSGLKKKFKHTDGVLDLFKKHQRPLYSKPFIERVVPGISMQLASRDNVWWFDFNPSTSYIISYRWAAGLGWNERLPINFKENRIESSDHIFGSRVFTEFKLREGFALKLETEWMNTFPNTFYPAYPQEQSKRSWVWSSFSGIKNSFNLSKKMRGQVQILYNLYNPEKQNPYLARVNFRFGVEYALKKKQKLF